MLTHCIHRLDWVYGRLSVLVITKDIRVHLLATEPITDQVNGMSPGRVGCSVPYHLRSFHRQSHSKIYLKRWLCELRRYPFRISVRSIPVGLNLKVHIHNRKLNAAPTIYISETENKVFRYMAWRQRTTQFSLLVFSSGDLFLNEDKKFFFKTFSSHSNSVDNVTCLTSAPQKDRYLVHLISGYSVVRIQYFI